MFMTIASYDVERPTRGHLVVLMRSALLTLLFIVPALIVRIGVALGVYGSAVVAASFMLAWAAEAAQIDVSGGLAIAVLALIAVLPEYAVDLYYAYTARQNPEYAQYDAANMTGSNRLLMGLGWPIVVLVAVAVARKLNGGKVTALQLDPSNRVELGFLLIAGVVAFGIHRVEAPERLSHRRGDRRTLTPRLAEA
jgi:cation:H+ antiporter